MPHVSAAERRPQLVEAAIDLMAREGVAAGSTRAVAAELGVAQATVHYTFGSKQELYRAVLEELTRALVEQVAAATPAEAGFEETFDAVVEALWHTVQAQPRRYLLLMELHTHALRDPYLREVVVGYVRGLDELASQLVADAGARTGQHLAQPPLTVARFFLSAFDGIVLRFLTDDDAESAATALRRLRQAALALATSP
ncbi:TetR/AcrR family transcriptional regulator [Nonomuraea africana]|uniref:AcrR family transcriptional regulator n=1 Tax=Nonomuraea africana TaxID=46171 RepID=A0ABR9KU55_9ACTN|nr:TetR family transcriptional regulator [Nonomuraea africana]MBE1565563.1 AcrR family transcriptional regulator [Nonomuraea africana]